MPIFRSSIEGIYCVYKIYRLVQWVIFGFPSLFMNKKQYTEHGDKLSKNQNHEGIVYEHFYNQFPWFLLVTFDISELAYWALLLFWMTKIFFFVFEQQLILKYYKTTSGENHCRSLKLEIKRNLILEFGLKLQWNHLQYIETMLFSYKCVTPCSIWRILTWP